MSTISAPGTRATRRAALATLLLGTFAGVLDLFIVTVAIPDIQADLGAGLGDAEWVVAGYTLAYAVALVIGGRLGDLWGARRVYAAGAVLFALTSAACAAAWSPGALVAARAAQGLAAAVMLSQVLALIQVLFPDAGPRRRALGAYSAVIGLAGIAGPLAGGVLIRLDVAGLGWRAIFCVNVPLCAAIAAGTAHWLPTTKTRRPAAPGRAGTGRAVGRARVDVVGAGLLALALVAGLLPVTGGVGVGWLGVSAVLFGGFGWWEARVARRGGAALLPPRLVRAPGFAYGMGAAVFFYGGNGALVFLLSYHLQHGQGLSAFATGMATAPMALASAVGSVVAGPLAGRLGQRVAPAGAVLMAAGALAVGAVALGQGAVWPLLPGLVAYGLGGGLVAPSLVGLALAGVAAADAGAASGGLLTVTQAANAVGVAVVGALYTAVAAGHGAATGFGSALLTDTLVFAALAALLAVLTRRRTR